MGETLRERRRRLLTDEILERVHVLISTKGYSAFSMEALASEVGISKPTLYSHFATKDDLLIAAMTRKMDELIATVVSTSGEPPLVRLATALREMLLGRAEAEHVAMRPWPELMELLCRHPEAISRMQQMEAAVAHAVEAGMQDGSIDAGLPVHSVVRSFFGLATSLAHSPFQRADEPPPSSADVQRDVESIVTIFMRGIRA